MARGELRRTVRFQERCVTYCGNHTPALAWIAEYLGAYFAIEEGVVDAPIVAGLVAPDLHAALLEILHGAEWEPSRTHTSSVAGSGPRWTWRGSRRFRLTPELTVHVLAETSGLTISDRASGAYVFLSASPDDDSRFEPVRMVRELFTRELEREGYVGFHAGAVALEDGSGVVICGPRGAGKTTLICGLLEHQGARFVTNVRSYVRVDDGIVDVVAWPWSVRIGFGTCSASPALRHWLESERELAHPQKDWNVAGSVESAIALHGGRPPAGGVIETKVELTAAELAAAMGTQVDAGAPVVSLVFPELAAGTGSTEVEDVSPGEAAERLKRQRAKIATDVHTDWLDLGLESRRVEVRSIDRRLDQLAESRPAVRLRVRDGREAAAAVAGLAVRR